MEYSIEILKERLEKLNESYNKFVLSGKVEINNPVAIDNRKKAHDIEEALLLLVDVMPSLKCTCDWATNGSKKKLCDKDCLFH